MPMQNFMMVYPASDAGPERRRTFKAVSMADAVLQTRGAAMEHAVELWKGRSRICTLHPGS